MAGSGRRYAPECKARMVELVRAGRSADRLARELQAVAEPRRGPSDGRPEDGRAHEKCGS